MLEVLYGGAGGGGKSEALLMAALQYVDIPGYSALILRRTYRHLALPEGLMDRAMRWLSPTDARFDSQEHTWRFPSGATLTFGYLDTENDKYRYQSAEFQYIAFDELTEFTESQYRYLFTRLRRREGTHIPLRMRAASNPGGPGHDWVAQRFGLFKTEDGSYAYTTTEWKQEHPDRIYLPARIEDNPYLDYDTYVQSLAQLDPVTRMQIQMGDWTARLAGGYFRREWFRIIPVPPPLVRKVRYWDLAATAPKRNQDPDWTAGALLGKTEKGWCIVHIDRFRGTPATVLERILSVAQTDGPEVEIRIEQEPGAGGKFAVDQIVRQLAGFRVQAVKPTTNKAARIGAFASQVEARNVLVVQGAWLQAFFDEAESFPSGAHDDQLDACAGAFEVLTKPEWIVY